MSGLRGYVLTLTAKSELITETCFSCGVLFALTEDFRKQRLRDRKNFYCPNGHDQHYVGETDADRLRKAQARETALRDQLDASVRDAEQVRQALLRDRQRFVNGVCPCCNRSFENVRRHMSNQHPDYDVTAIKNPIEFACSCGRSFGSLHGLRIHQGRSRPENWTDPKLSDYRRHLTAGASR